MSPRGCSHLHFFRPLAIALAGALGVLTAGLAQAADGQPAAGTPRALVLKTVLGLVMVLALAYMAGHPRVRQLEARLRISQVITAGLPFLVLGGVASLPAVGVLSERVLGDIGPLLRIGLGWLGFVVGLRFDARLLSGLDGRTARFVAVATLLPFASVVIVSGGVLVGAGESLEKSFRDPVFLRDALLLGTAASMTAATAPLLLGKQASEGAIERVWRIVRLEEVAGMAGLAVIAAFFRPAEAQGSWHLPGAAWLLLTVGLGATLGALTLAMLARAKSHPELIVLLLGAISFTAGLAGSLHLSSVVVCFVAAVIIANFPGGQKERIWEVVVRLERPLYLVFLFVVGALISVGAWRGWVLLPLFVAARLFGKWLSAQVVRRTGELSLSPTEERVLVIAPVGSLAIAIVVNAQLLHPGGFLAEIVIAVVGGSLVTEGLVQVFLRRPAAQAAGGGRPP